MKEIWRTGLSLLLDAGVPEEEELSVDFYLDDLLTDLTGHIARNPFLSREVSKKEDTLCEILNIQKTALLTRMRKIGSHCAVIGISTPRRCESS